MREARLFDGLADSVIEVTFVYGEGYGQIIKSMREYAVPEWMNMDDVQSAVEDLLDFKMNLPCLSKTNYFDVPPVGVEGEIVHEDTRSIRINHTEYDGGPMDEGRYMRDAAAYEAELSIE